MINKRTGCRGMTRGSLKINVMDYHVLLITANRYEIKLSPVTVREQQLLETDSDRDAISAFYQHAVIVKLDRHHAASAITPERIFLTVPLSKYLTTSHKKHHGFDDRFFDKFRHSYYQL